MKAIMPLLKYRINDGTLFLLFSLWIGTNSVAALQLCQSGTTTTNFINLNLDSSPITGTNGMCSCTINFTNSTRISMFPIDINSPSCNTKLALSDTLYKFTCKSDGEIDYTKTYVRSYNAGDVLWLFVTSTVSAQQPMTGTLQIKTTQQDYILECFNPNTNTSVATQPTTTKTTTPTTTSASTTDKSTTSQPSSGTSSVSSKVSGANTGTTTKPTASTSISTTASREAGNSSNQGTGPNKNPPDDFPVAAVAGGVGGGLLLIIVIIIAATCLRRKKKEPHLLENSGDAIKEDKGRVNRAHFQPKQNKSNSNHNTGGNGNVQNHFKDNELYASVDVPNKQQPRDNNFHNPPEQYASVDVINPGRSVDDHDLVEGPEIVITSSGDMYAVVDNLDKSAPENRMDHEVSPSGDMYAVVDKSKLSKVQQEAKQNNQVSASGDLYAVVNKPNKSSVSFADDVTTEPNSQAQSTDDMYAVVNKPKRDQVFSSDTGTLEAGEEEEEEDAINRMMSVPEIVLQDRVSFVESTTL